jgi:hypothetical protein
MTKRVYYFEDLAPGTVLEFGDAEMTAEAIIEFARQFDPQPFTSIPKRRRLRCSAACARAAGTRRPS